jgi:type VI secretion system secreted protein VgrG
VSTGRISITAKEEVVINGEGSYTIWNASGIVSGTTGTHTVQAASHDFLPGKSLPMVTPEMPTGAVDAKRGFSS